MAGKSLTTKIIFSGHDGVSGVINRISNNLNSITRGVDAISGRMMDVGQRMSHVGAMMSVGVTYPMLRASTAIVTAQKEFESALNTLSRRTGITLASELDEITEAANRLGAATKYTATEVVQAMAEIGAAGFKDVKAIKMVADVVVPGSVAADMSTKRFGEELIQATSAFYGITDFDTADPERQRAIAAQMQAISENLALAAAVSTADVSDLLTSFKELAPIMKVISGNNPDIKQTAALLATLAQNGIKGAEAGVALRSGLIRALAPTTKASRMMLQEGINLSDYLDFQGDMLNGDRFLNYITPIAPDAEKLKGKIDAFFKQPKSEVIKGFSDFQASLTKAMKLKPADAKKLEDRSYEFLENTVESMRIPDLLKTLNDKKIGPAVMKELFSLYHMSKFMPLAQNPEAIANMQKAMANFEAGILEKINPLTGQRYRSATEFMAAQEMRGLPGALDVLKANFDAMKRSFYTAWDYIDKQGNRQNSLTDSIMEYGVGMAKWIETWDPAVKKMIVGVGAATAIIGPLLVYAGFAVMGLGALASAAGKLFAPLVLAGRGLTLLMTALTAFAGRRVGLAALGILTRFGVAGMFLAAAGYAIYKSWASISKIFKDVWNSPVMERSLKTFESAFKNLFAGNYAVAATQFAGALRMLGDAAWALGSKLGGLALTRLQHLFEFIDTITPNFAKFRTALRAIGYALADLMNALSGFSNGGDLGAAQRTVAEYLRIFADAAWEAAAKVLNKVAQAVRILANAIRDFRSGYGDGGFMGGLRSMLDGMSGFTQAVTIGLVAGGLIKIASAMRGLAGLSAAGGLAAMLGMIGRLSLGRIILISGAIALIADKLGLLQNLNMDWVDAFITALAGFQIAKALAGMFAGGVATATTAGAVAGAAYGTSFGTSAAKWIRRGLMGLGALAAIEIARDMPSGPEEWKQRIEQNRRSDASSSGWLAGKMPFSLGWGKDGQADWENSPAKKMIDAIKGLFPAGPGVSPIGQAATRPLSVADVLAIQSSEFPGKARDDLDIGLESFRQQSLSEARRAADASIQAKSAMEGVKASVDSQIGVLREIASGIHAIPGAISSIKVMGMPATTTKTEGATPTAQLNSRGKMHPGHM